LLCLATDYLGKQMPEIVAILQLRKLALLGTKKEADEGALDDVLLIGAVQTLALEFGARQPQEPPEIAGQQLLRGGSVAFLDPPDQLGNRPGRGHRKNRPQGEIASRISEADFRKPITPLQVKRQQNERVG